MYKCTSIITTDEGRSKLGQRIVTFAVHNLATCIQIMRLVKYIKHIELH